MEIIWITEKVIDDREVITHIDWTATARQGVHTASRKGREALPLPDPAVVEAYLRQPTAEQLVAGVGWADLPDPPGFMRPEWIERDTLHPWLFAIIDRGAIERELIAEIQPKPDDVVEEARNANPELFSNTEPDSDGIPDAFRGLMMVEESPERFTERMRRRWQALKHMQIDGSKPSLARALPDMSEEERVELADLEARNKITRWLD